MASAVALATLRQYLFALILLAFCAWWPLITFLRRRAQRPPPRAGTIWAVARASGIFSVAFATVMGWSAWSATASTPAFSYPSYGSSGSGGPNIYLILLDGYPRADTLESTFALDGTQFSKDLEKAGFTVADGARSNYNKTWSTIASMLNGDYIDSMMDGRDVPRDITTQIRWLQSMINRASLLDVVRERGYVIRTIPEAFRSTALMSADEVIDHGHLTEFEGHLISFSPWALLAGDAVREFLADAQESAVRDGLEATAELAEHPPDEPQFVFAHVQSPHTPFVLHPDTTERSPLPACVPGRCAFWNATIEELGVDLPVYREALRKQLEELNSIVLETVSRIAAADPEAIVVLMSDHGVRYSLGDVPEQYRSFLAARTPGVASVFSEDESPVNLLRKLFAAYFDSGLPALPYEAWASPWIEPLRLERLDRWPR